MYLTNAQTKLDAFDAQMKDFREAITDIESRWPDKNGIVDSLTSLEKDLVRARNEFNRIGALDRLVTLGANYIEETKPHECPICAQQIQPDSLVVRLRSQTSAALVESSKALKEKEKEARFVYYGY